MANNVRAVAAGGIEKVLSRTGTVADVASELNVTNDYTAAVNGQPVSFSHRLRDNDYVTFAPKLKAG